MSIQLMSVRIRSLAVGLTVGLALAALVGASPAMPQSATAAGTAESANADVAGSEKVTGAAFDKVSKALEQLTRGKQLDELRRTPVAGVLEARIGNDLLYVEENGRYLFLGGDLIDLQTRRNLSQERVDELMAIRFEELPLALAFKHVSGKGTRQLAVFEDPNCGYCKRLRADLLKLDDVTIHTFPMAFLAADSEKKAKTALCAPDPTKAWNEMMVEGKTASNDGDCETTLEETRELAMKLGITGTPVTFFEDGKRLVGYVQPDRFKEMLEEAARSRK